MRQNDKGKLAASDQCVNMLADSERSSEKSGMADDEDKLPYSKRYTESSAQDVDKPTRVAKLRSRCIALAIQLTPTTEHFMDVCEFTTRNKSVKSNGTLLGLLDRMNIELNKPDSRLTEHQIERIRRFDPSSEQMNAAFARALSEIGKSK